MTATETAASRLSPGQAALRFLIELAALTAWGVAGWNMTDSVGRWLLAVGLPVAAGTIWATFRVPGDESAGGGAPVPVPGLVRLLIEFDVLLGAAVVVAVFWRVEAGLVLAAAVVAHYALTPRRVRWLLAS